MKNHKRNPYNLETRVFEAWLHKGDHFEKLLEKCENVKLINNSGPAIVYYFEVRKETNILGKLIPRGQYILKWQRMKDEEVEYLELLSNEKLIPKILLFENFEQWGINSVIMITEYFQGIDLQKLLNQWKRYEELKDIHDRNLALEELKDIHDRNLALKKSIWKEIERTYERWIVKNYKHGDLQPKNIMISPKGKIMFIDPLLYDGDGYKSMKSGDLRELKGIKSLLIPFNLFNY